MTECVALIVAAGRGTRAGGALPKQYRALGGRPVLRWSPARFRSHPPTGSVRLGLESLETLRPKTVLIHDAARPFIDADTIARTIDALAESPGAIVAVPVADTIKRGESGRVAGTVDRTGLWRAQTPQGFRF